MNDFKQKDVKIMCMTTSKLRYDVYKMTDTSETNAARDKFWF